MHWIRQNEQPNGFYIIEAKQDNSNECPINFAITDGEQHAFLFKQQGQHLWFLSDHPFNNDAQWKPRNNQAWTFLNELTSSLTSSQPLLITGSNQAMATVFYLADQLRADFDIRVILASQSAFPFMVKPARFLFPDFPAEAIGAATLLEDWKIPNRLCSEAALPGCFDGQIQDLWSQWSAPYQWQHINCDHLIG